MSDKPDTRRISIECPAQVYEDFFQLARKHGESMSWRIVKWMHQQTGHKVPPPPQRGAKPRKSK